MRIAAEGSGGTMANEAREHAAETLETGNAPTTPPGDNLGLEFVRDLASSWRAHAEHAGRCAHVDDDLGVAFVDTQSPSLFMNLAVILRPLAAHDAATFTTRAVEFFGARDGGMFAVWSLWPLPDLRPYGFPLGGHPPWMVRDGSGTPPATPAELRIVEVHDRDTAAAYEVALVNGFPVPELQPPRPGCFFEGDVLHAPGWRHFVGYVGDEPVATASAYVGDSLVRVDNIAT